MIFTSPAILWALPLAATPLILHLLSRLRTRPLSFSDLSFLRGLERRQRVFSNLKRRLLLACRVLALLLLILAYAGPVERSAGGPSTGAQGLDLVLLVDRSYSMRAHDQGKTRFEKAKAAGEAVLASLGPQDRVALAPFSDRLETPDGTLSFQSPSEASAALARLDPGFGTTNYGAALKAASDFLMIQKDIRRPVALVLSDSAKHGFRPNFPALDSRVLWLGLSLPEPPENAYVASAGPAPQSVSGKPQLQIKARGLHGASIPLDAWLGQTRLESGAFSGGEPEQSLTLGLPPNAGTGEAAKNVLPWSGRVTLRPDALSEDDSYFYSFEHARTPRLLCLYGNPDFFETPYGGYFLEGVLAQTASSGFGYSCDFLPLSRADAGLLSGYGGVLLADFKSAPAEFSSMLEKYIRDGGALWLIPGGRSEALDFSGFSWAAAGFGPMVQGEGPGVAPAASATIDPQNSPEPLWPQFDLKRVTFSRYFLLQARPGSKIIFRSASGYPLLVVGAHGLGRTVVSAAPFDLSWSNLALKPLFPVWVKTALDEATAASERKTRSFDLKIGQFLLKDWPAGSAAPQRARVRGPGGELAVLRVINRRAAYGPILSPGLYELIEDETGKKTDYAVNLDRSTGESDLTPASNVPWKALPAESAVSEFKLDVYGRPLRQAALSLALLCLLIEMLLSRSRVLAALVLALSLTGAAQAQPVAVSTGTAPAGERFAWTQLKLGDGWDPYPDVPGRILRELARVTSVLVNPRRRILSIKDKDLFLSPILVLSGHSAPEDLTPAETDRLRAYLTGGGFLWIEDTSGTSYSTFDAWARKTAPLLLPESPLKPLPPDDVVFKTFFLLRRAAGRVLLSSSLEGAFWNGQLAILYSRNDLLGAWAMDAFGAPLYPCEPGGEAQREEAKRLTLNILMYVLTGNYKADAVHQPFILMKLGRPVVRPAP